MKHVQRVLAAIGLLYVVVTATPVTEWWARALAGPWTEARGNVLIVPGGDYLADGSIGLHSYWRVTYAARAWREGGFMQIVVSGAVVGKAMQKFLVAEGVPEDAILVENDSLSTRQNALNTYQALRTNPGRLVLMTSDYHMFRAIRAFRNAGLHLEPRVIPDALKQAATWKGRWPAFLDLSEETVKLMYYYLRLWL